jgi:uncharacterized protein (DUF1499 family)
LTKVILVLIALVLIAQLTIRLWPIRTTKWHVAINPATPANAKACPIMVRGDFDGTLLDVLAKVAAASPRTQLLAGSPEDGRMTWVTRSLVWGFPDVTTAQLDQNGLCIVARQVLGTNDHGVNAARLESWLAEAFQITPET